MEVLDREGESSERRIYVYRVQNGRSADLAKVLANAFAGREPPTAAATTGAERGLPRRPQSSADRAARAEREATAAPTSNLATPPGQLSPVGGSASTETSTPNGASSGQPVSVDIATDGLHAKISSDETNNAIIVYATPRDYAVVEDALRRLDVVPTQVLIEAAIVEVTLNDNLRYGVQWSFNTSKTNIDPLARRDRRARPGTSPDFRSSTPTATRSRRRWTRWRTSPRSRWSPRRS